MISQMATLPVSEIAAQLVQLAYQASMSLEESPFGTAAASHGALDERSAGNGWNLLEESAGYFEVETLSLEFSMVTGSFLRSLGHSGFPHEVGKSGGDMGCCWQQQPRLSTQRPLAVTGTWRLDGIISIGLVGGLQMNGIEDWELGSENEWCSNNLAAMEPNFAMRSLKPYFHQELRNRVPLEKG